MQEIESKVSDLIKGKLENLGYELKSVKFQKENKENYLRIIVDKEDDISLEDIVFITDLISPLLDVNDIISEKYILDISSLGVEKEIDVAKIDKYVGKYINIHLINAIKGMNNIIGTLLEVNNEQILITYKQKTRNINVNINRDNIDKANLAIKF